MITRELAELVFQRAVAACDPGRRVHDALARWPAIDRSKTIGVAVGKSALAMARGIGAVARGLAVTVAEDGGELPPGWRLLIASHPVPDERSLVAGRAVLELVKSASEHEHVIFAISGGASSLIEQPRIPPPEFRAVTSAVMAAGASIAVLNTVRSALSAIKGGQLALACRAPITTLAASDVVGDHLEIIGSGPTIGPWLDNARHDAAGRVDVGAWADERRGNAILLLERLRVSVPSILRHSIASRMVARAGDRAEIVSPLGEFATHARQQLAVSNVPVRGPDHVMSGDVVAEAVLLAKRVEQGPLVAYGEPTVRLPTQDPSAANGNLADAATQVGEGGRAQQLALELAKRFRGTSHVAFVAGTDGKDGPAPHTRLAPAGAFIDGTTWDRIVAAGIDPDLALARCDAGPALDAVGALFVCGPTGINHADLAIVG